MIAGVDVGGTFTDLIYFDGERFGVVKVPTAPKRPERGVLNALDSAGIDVKDLNVLVHATTLGTNMLLGQEGLKPPRVALVTTKGFRDVIEIGRQRRPETYNPFFERPKPLVRRRDRYEVEERVSSSGEVVKPVREEELRRLAKVLRGYDVIVVAFIHSYKNPENEIMACKILRDECPNSLVVASHEVIREYREYERFCTAVLNAMLMPMMSGYLRRLRDELSGRGFSGRLLIMQSNGGVSTVESSLKTPIAFVESGPAAGAIAVSCYSKEMGIRFAIGFDMGGTTAKACTVVDGAPHVTRDYEVGGRVHAGRIVRGTGYPVRFPFIDLAEVSAGGGTIAWVDEGGALRVGPLSAGADPGPACYGKGGRRATVTDANLYLGRLGERLSTMRLRRDLAEMALRDLADELGCDLDEVALGILEIVNTTMAKALRIVTVERGYNPEDFVMFAFGGAGPLHAADLLPELGVDKVVIPPHAGAFSAFGLLLADYRVDKVRTVLGDESTIRRTFEELEREAVAELPKVEVRVYRFLEMRYKGQGYEITVPWRGSLELAVEDFHRRHEEIYGFSSDDEVEVVNVRLTVVGVSEKPKIRRVEKRSYTPKPIGYRDVCFGEWVRCGIYRRVDLRPGAEVMGPAVIEDYDSTTVVPPEFVAEVDGYCNLVLRRCQR